jgi:hypothetical protein
MITSTQCELRRLLILLTLKSVRKGTTLATHYTKCYGHMIPFAVEIWEFDLETSEASVQLLCNPKVTTVLLLQVIAFGVDPRVPYSAAIAYLAMTTGEDKSIQNLEF